MLRLLRGELLDELSRELKVEAHPLADWRDDFLDAGSVGPTLKAYRPTYSPLPSTSACPYLGLPQDQIPSRLNSHPALAITLDRHRPALRSTRNRLRRAMRRGRR